MTHPSDPRLGQTGPESALEDPGHEAEAAYFDNEEREVKWEVEFTNPLGSRETAIFHGSWVVEWFEKEFPGEVHSVTSIGQGPAIAEVKDKMKKYWLQFEEEMRDRTNYEGSVVVYEDEKIAIVTDETQSLLDNLLRNHATPTQEVKQQMKDIAADKIDANLSSVDVLVFPKK